jgi:adenylosuccinate synthase
VIGPGVVVNPAALLDEFALLEQHGVSTHNMVISIARMSCFRATSTRLGAEDARGGAQLGTTRQGIWPAR